MDKKLDYLEKRLKEIRESKIDSVTKIYWDYHYRINLNLAITNTQKNDKILDVGCGIGGYIIALSKIGRICYGIDPLLETSLSKAEKKAKEEGVNINLIQGVGENLPFPNGFFNMVLCLSTLQHVENQNKVLTEIWRALKEGGYLLISVLLDKNLFGIFRRKKESVYVTYPFSLKELKLILNNNNFQILEIKGVGCFPPLVHRILFILHRLFGEKLVGGIIELLDGFAKIIPSLASSIVILAKK